MTQICFWVAMFFFIAAICCGADAIKLERRISPAWCAVVAWCLLLAGGFFFSVVLVRG
jgi:uncharacterized membrane protein